MMHFLRILKSFANNPYSIYEAQEHAPGVLLLCYLKKREGDEAGNFMKNENIFGGFKTFLYLCSQK